MKIYSMIREEKADNPFIFPGLEEYADTILSQYKGTMKNCTLLSKKEYKIGEKQGLLIVVSGTVAKMDIKYYTWCYLAHSYAYQVISWEFDDKKDSTTVPPEIEQFYSSFQVFPGESPGTIVQGNTLYTSDFGYTIDYKTSGFTPWEDIQQYYNYAESGGYYGSDAAFHITSLYTWDLNPSPEALTQGYLGALGIEYTNADLKDYKRVTHGGLSGVEFIYSADINYRYRILKAPQYAYFITILEKRNLDASVLKNLYDSIHIDTEFNEPKQAHSTRDNNSAQILNNIGILYYNNNQYSKSLSCFRVAFDLNMKRVDYLENYIHIMTRLEKYEEGLEYLEKYRELFPDNFTLRSYTAFFQMQTGQDEQALFSYQSLFSEGYRQDYDFIDYVNLLWEMQKKEEAFQAIAVYQEEKFSVLIARIEAGFYEQEGNYDKAITQLMDLYKSSIYDEDLTLDLCLTLRNAGRYEQAIEICDEILREGHESAEIYFTRGLNQLELSWYEEAKRSLEKAYELNPTDTTLKEYLDYVSGLLGETDNTLIKNEIEAVPVAKKYLRFTDNALSKSFSGKDAFYLHRVTAVSYKKDREMKRTMYYHIKVLTYTGISYFSTFTIPFEPSGEGIYVNECKVFDEKGNLVSTVDPSRYFVMDDTSRNMATNSKVLNIPISGLQPGYTFSVIVTWNIYNFKNGPDYHYDYLARMYPIVNNYVILSGDIDEIICSTKNMNPPKREKGNLVFRVSEPVELLWEPYQDMRCNYAPVIHIGNASNTWEGVAGLYLDDLEEKFVLSEDVKKLCSQLVASCKDDEEKICTLATYVQENYTYKAIEFGTRGWIPNDGSTIIHNKYGDCKDLSLLLYLFLKSENIPSYLALTNSSKLIVPDLPDLKQFDHVILYIPGYKQGFFMDPTSKYYDITQLQPNGLGGQHCLILDRENPRIEQIPVYPDNSNILESGRGISIAKNGTVTVQEELRHKKYAASFIRAYLKQFDTLQYKTQIQNYMSVTMPGVQLKKLETINMDDTEKDFILKLEYTTGSSFKQLDKKLIGTLPAVWERSYIYIQHLTERKTPFRIIFPLTVKSNITVTIPAGFQYEKDLQQKKEENEYAHWSIAQSFENGTLNIQFDFHLKQGSYPKEKYTAFEQAVNSAIEELECGIVLLE